ncbi:MAG: putative lipid II flippase FtsW, partial [Candidatus Omnitrophota bacterium]
SAVYAYGKYADSMFFVKRHLMYLFSGLIAAVLCMSVNSRFIRDNARYIMLISIILLVIVLIPGIGRQVGGARRWLRFAGIGFQPSELAKLFLIIYLADFTYRKRYMIHRVKFGFMPPLAVTGLTGGLVLLEPDMGTFVSIALIGFLILFVAGARLKHMAVIGACMLPGLVLAVLCAPYRMKRILAFCDPWKDARGAGFQLIQSFIALGSGGLFGVGLGSSKQKLFYLPESHTDFIFSIIGEELGFVGAASVLILFAVMIWFSFRISFKIRDLFMSRVVFGIAVMIAFEVIVNIGVSTGFLPTKGLPLPFISYGGTSIIVHLAAMGMLFNMAREAEYDENDKGAALQNGGFGIH